MKCRLCNSPDLKLSLKLPDSEIGDTFTKTANEQVKKYPYTIYTCVQCGHVQCHDVLEQSELFGHDYSYTPSYSKKLESHFDFYANKLASVSNAKNLNEETSLAIDIGSNDGLFLRCLKKRLPVDVLGIEPAEAPRAFSEHNGIPAIDSFFSSALAKDLKEQIARKGQKVNFVSANNVFAHCDNLQDFAKGISELLDDDGIFCFEISYLVDIINKALIGVFFHEHLSHHALLPLDRFLRTYNLFLFDAIEVDQQGGALICFARKSKVINNDQCLKSERLKQLFEIETDMKLDTCESGRLLEKSLIASQARVHQILDNLKSENKRIGYFGASRSLSMLSAFYNLTSYGSIIIDDNPNKVGKYLPNSDLRVVRIDESKLEELDCILITAWVPAQIILEKLVDDNRFNGKAIKLNPECVVVQC